MKGKIAILLLVAMLAPLLTLPVISGTAQAQTGCGYPTTGILMAEDGSTVGSIQTTNDVSAIHTRITPSSGWLISSVDHHVAQFYSGIPKNGGGSFDYDSFGVQNNHDPAVASGTYSVGRRWNYGRDLHIATRVTLVQSGGSATMVAWGYMIEYNDTLYSKHLLQSCGLFGDVPVASKEWMEPWVQSFYYAGITGGCGTEGGRLMYCPEREVTRAEMAVFVLRAMKYPDLPYTPADQGGSFVDVPVAGKEWMEDWIEEFFDRGITGGCGRDGGGNLMYCPERQVTRAEMAVFLLRAKKGADFVPPARPSSFIDVPVAGKEWMQPWIEQFYRDGITGGCGRDGSGNLMYCPERPVTRAEMAVFLIRTFTRIPKPD